MSPFIREIRDEDYTETDPEARFWHRRYDEQHRTVHWLEDELARVRHEYEALQKLFLAMGKGSVEAITELGERLEKVAGMVPAEIADAPPEDLR